MITRARFLQIIGCAPAAAKAAALSTTRPRSGKMRLLPEEIAEIEVEIISRERMEELNRTVFWRGRTHVNGMPRPDLRPAPEIEL